jgi:hypothetical protein
MQDHKGSVTLIQYGLPTRNERFNILEASGLNHPFNFFIYLLAFEPVSFFSSPSTFSLALVSPSSSKVM